ncbi:MAG: RNA 3'-terminal phosphate cyclase [Patescibacteria group bacterium]|nr:RNA 3'-terminal phosphate cyclase [Patescibacteria group bacterium]
MRGKILRIDGSYGEGGGQILRTSLSLSIITNQAVEIFNIRAKRKNPGLQAQHLAAVRAAEKISQAKISGAKIGSQVLKFEPKKIKFGKFEFDIGTAGSTTLVAQTILLPLAFSKHPSEVLIIGGTHNPLAPPFHYFSEVFLPTIEKLGIKAESKLEKYGFYPRGGGRMRLFVSPTAKIEEKNFLTRGKLQKISGLSTVANLNFSIAERQKEAVLSILKNITIVKKIKTEKISALSPGTFIFLKAEFEDTLAGFSSLGAIGKPAEKVGQEAAKDFLAYFHSNKVLDPYLADQIVLYLALTKKPFAFTVSKITNHLLTHLWLLEKFLGVKIKVDQNENKIFKE